MKKSLEKLPAKALGVDMAAQLCNRQLELLGILLNRVIAWVAKPISGQLQAGVEDEGKVWVVDCCDTLSPPKCATWNEVWLICCSSQVSIEVVEEAMAFRKVNVVIGGR